MSPPYYGERVVSGSVTLGIWAKKAGAWQLVTYADVYVYKNVGTLGQHTVNWSFNGSFDLGPAVQAFGVTVESFTGISATVADLVQVQWSATASSGERSATPSGQQSTVVVRPQ